MRKSSRRISTEVLAILAGLVAAFLAPMWAVDLAADKGFSGAVVFTTGLKNLGLGDMGRGIGACGLIGVLAALVVALVSYLIILQVSHRSK